MAEWPRCVPRTTRLFETARAQLPTLFIFLLLLSPGLLCAETNPIDVEAGKLRELRARISAFKSELESVRGQHDSQQQALARTDKAIGAISAELRRLRREARQAGEKLAALETERSAARTQLNSTRRILERELRSAWLGGRQQRIKLLLNQDDPAVVGRMMTYQAYFTRARTQRLEQFQATIERLRLAEQALLEQQATIEELHIQQQEQSSRLSLEQETQRGILAGLEKQLKAGTTELSRLEQDEQRVHQLLQSLQQALRDIPPLESSQQSLRQLKGKLRWPAAGSISTPYGARQAAGKMQARGVHISSPSGTDVHAVAKGRIAFADWLRGFGLLIIIDHGAGYMSLYGENSSLYKAVGEWVSQGEVIAAAGNSGGQLRTGVYFELRKDGQPINPAAWFKGKPAALSAGR
jgi:septal ring factor EnvC (AmiA/AmiB activator)